MPPTPQGSTSRLPRATQRKRVGSRTLTACVNCKERKLRCDAQISCANCQRLGLICLVEDAATKRLQPRNYLEILEKRLAHLEGVHQHDRRDLDSMSSTREDLQRSPDGLDASISSLPIDPAINDSLLANRQGGQAGCDHRHQVHEEENDLTSHVGMLSLAAGAEPQYLGPSSSFAFSQVISAAFVQVLPQKSREVSRSAANSGSTPTPCLLPDPVSCVKLRNAYFRNVHTEYPFLHEPTIWQYENQLFRLQDGVVDSEPHTASLFFLFMVYAIGALLLPGLNYSSELFASAQLYFDHVLRLGNLEVVQAYLCYAVYSLRSPTGTSVWRFSGLALRQCVEFGYHRKSRGQKVNINPLRTELTKRVFWCAWTIDCMAADVLGRPLGLQHEEVDCEYPLDVDDIHISEIGIDAIPRTSNQGQPTRMTKALHSFRLRRLVARIHASLYSNLTTEAPDHPNYRARVQTLRAELEIWQASKPPLMPHDGEVLSFFNGPDWYDCCYNHLIILLYRDQSVGGNALSDVAFRECMEAAANLCRYYRRGIIGKPTTLTWGALHTLFLAGLTYIHCLWSSQSLRATARQDIVSSTCSDCLMVLVLMAQWHEAAAPYRDIFETLSSKTMTMLVENSKDSSLFADVTLQPDPSGSNDFMRWMEFIADDEMSGGFDTLLSEMVSENPFGIQDS